MNELRADLDRARGHWPRIARETTVDYFTIARIARGDTANPRIDTVEQISAWLEANQALLRPGVEPAAAA